MSKRKMTYNKGVLALAVGVSILTVGFFIYNQKTTSPTVLGTTSATPSTSSAKEFFVPFGYGSVNSASDWTDVPGLQATVDSWQYPKIKQVLFETTVYSPNGNQTVSVRLRNYDGYSYPAVSMEGTGPNLLTSSPFTISPGPKTYYVQYKTQLGFPIQIYQARLHITTY